MEELIKRKLSCLRYQEYHLQRGVIYRVLVMKKVSNNWSASAALVSVIGYHALV